jgi:hypothetical protein
MATSRVVLGLGGEDMKRFSFKVDIPPFQLLCLRRNAKTGVPCQGNVRLNSELWMACVALPISAVRRRTILLGKLLQLDCDTVDATGEGERCLIIRRDRSNRISSDLKRFKSMAEG